MDPSDEHTPHPKFMRVVRLRVMQKVRSYYERTGKPLRVHIVTDESNVVPIGAIEVSAAEQLLKMGCRFTYIFQSLVLAEKDLLDRLLQASEQQIYFRQSSWESAVLAAKQLVRLDEHKVLDVERRERTIVDGYESVPTTSRQERWMPGRYIDGYWKDGDYHTSRTTGESVRPVHRIVTDNVNRYQSLDKQILSLANELRGERMQTGFCRYKFRTFVSEEPVNFGMMESLWAFSGLREVRVAEALERIRSQPIFHKPNLKAPQAETELWVKPKMGAAARLRAKRAAKQLTGGNGTGRS